MGTHCYKKAELSKKIPTIKKNIRFEKAVSLSEVRENIIHARMHDFLVKNCQKKPKFFVLGWKKSCTTLYSYILRRSMDLKDVLNTRDYFFSDVQNKNLFSFLKL